jgi:CO dehydrogenase/acetyl-CoA synthase beta subunit
MSDELKKHRCPQCLEMEGVEIAYGMPSAKTRELVEAGLTVLGGCVLCVGAPTHQCLWCEHKWGRLTFD